MAMAGRARHPVVLTALDAIARRPPASPPAPGRSSAGLVILGGFEAFFVPDGVTDGLWLAFIGWFLMAAATAEMKAAVLRQKLAGRPLRCFTGGAADLVPADATVDDAIEVVRFLRPERLFRRPAVRPAGRRPAGRRRAARSAPPSAIG